MKDENQEIIRRILANVLSRLERGDSYQTAQSYGMAERAANGESNPVILIVLNNSETSDARAPFNAMSATGETGKRMEVVSLANSATQAAHPGLERFVTVENKTCDVAPKMCFMEPDRACVHSGACEMRGY
jgi:hypothetical protein